MIKIYNNKNTTHCLNFSWLGFYRIYEGKSLLKISDIIIEFGRLV